MRSGISRAHSHWLAERIAQCTWSGQCNTDWYGLVRTGTDMAQNVCVPCAFEFPERMARTTPCAPRSVLFRTHPYLSVRHCSQYRLCAMHTANRRECALFSGERIFPPLAADGIPNGIRTRVAGMRTRCPRPLDDGNTSMIRCLYYTPHPGKSKFTFLLFRSFYT